ncbi:MAG TPA: glycosyltransferase family 4 protein [Vicinamibacteria bacterium]|jgi:glycosyltransferase involved in cell wall biosynthesis|nr:glycosyltransferase family 4 protein [Vicinamibacteria bacterium]
MPDDPVRSAGEGRSILHIMAMTSTKYGSLERYLVELVRSTNAAGYRTVLQYEAPPWSATYRSDLEALGASFVVSPLLNLPLALPRLLGLLRTVRPEIVYTHFCDSPLRFLVPELTRLFRVRKTFAMVYVHPHLRAGSAKRFAYRLYDRVFAVSEAASRNLVEAGVDPRIVTTHYLGLFGQCTRSSSERLRLRRELGLGEESLVLGCIAFDSPVKGIDVLLEAFSGIVRNHPEVRLLVIGVNPRDSDLPRQAALRGISERVHWAGIRDEGWRLLNAADLYVQPSRSEALPLAIVEAMALELPVLATRAGGLPEVVIEGETGYLAEPEDVGDLQATLERCLADRADWRRLGEAGRARYERFFDGALSVRRLVKASEP